MKSLALLILLIGIILITLGYSKTSLKCPPPKVEYRLVPHTFYDEQMSNQNLMNLDIFRTNSFNGNHYESQLSDRDENYPINLQNIFN